MKKIASSTPPGRTGRGKKAKKKSLFKSKRIMIEDFSHYRHAVTAALFILMNI